MTMNWTDDLTEIDDMENDYFPDLNEPFVRKILKSMFDGWDFDFEIDFPTNIYSFFFKLTEKSNTIEVHTTLKDSENTLEVSIYKKSETFEVVGIYDISNDKFHKTSAFFEVMFSEHIINEN